MNYSDPDLQDRLAADYVAGVLRAGARRRFIELLREDAALRQRVRDWEERLLPLAQALPPQAPPEHVWSAIAARIRSRPQTVPPAPAARPRPREWRGWSWWRTLGAGLAAAMVVLAFLVLMPSTPREGLRTLAVLSGDQAPAALVLNRLPDKSLSVQPMRDLTQLAGGRALELWAITPGLPPRSLGLVVPGQISKLRPRLPPLPGDTVAVSLEPPGGSPTGAPTGPVVLSGPVI